MRSRGRRRRIKRGDSAIAFLAAQRVNRSRATPVEIGPILRVSLGLSHDPSVARELPGNDARPQIVEHKVAGVRADGQHQMALAPSRLDDRKRERAGQTSRAR